MMPTEHDEALVERVALAMCKASLYGRGLNVTEEFTLGALEDAVAVTWVDKARAAIYPPAPPKTRLQVARELLATARFNVGCNPNLILEGRADESSDMQAILAALALPAMED